MFANATAFASKAALVAACRKGYVPTLRVDPADLPQVQGEVRRVREELTALGLRVYPAAK